PAISRKTVITEASSFSIRVLFRSSMSTSFATSNPLCLRARAEPDLELAVECLRDPQERVDLRRAAARLEPGDRGLSRAAELGQVLLRQAAGRPLLRHLLGDPREEPAVVPRPRKPLSQ